MPESLGAEHPLPANRKRGLLPARATSTRRRKSSETVKHPRSPANRKSNDASARSSYRERKRALASKLAVVSLLPAARSNPEEKPGQPPGPSRSPRRSGDSRPVWRSQSERTQSSSDGNRAFRRVSKTSRSELREVPRFPAGLPDPGGPCVPTSEPWPLPSKLGADVARGLALGRILHTTQAGEPAQGSPKNPATLPASWRSGHPLRPRHRTSRRKLPAQRACRSARVRGSTHTRKQPRKPANRQSSLRSMEIGPTSKDERIAAERSPVTRPRPLPANRRWRGHECSGRDGRTHLGQHSIGRSSPTVHPPHPPASWHWRWGPNRICIPASRGASPARRTAASSRPKGGDATLANRCSQEPASPGHTRRRARRPGWLSFGEPQQGRRLGSVDPR